MKQTNEMVVYTGKKQLHMANAMYNLGKMYASSREAFGQPIENSTDAMHNNDLKPTIWVAIYSEQIKITDNGCGMLPVMAKSDQHILADYFSHNDKTVPDIRAKLSNAARHSLVWLSDYVSYSPKNQEAGENVSGVRGIGALAYMTYAKNATITSCPARWLIDELIKLGTPMPRGQSFSLEMPEIHVYKDWIMESKIIAHDEPLTDPFGKVLSHGTQVVISGFNDTTLTTSKSGSLTPGRVLSYLKSKINTDTVSVYVGDFTKHLPSSKVWVKVTKEEVKGSLVYSGQTTSADGAPFTLRLFYDPLKETNSPYVTRRNTPVFHLTAIDELNHHPWNKLGGEIQFPQYMIDAALWNAQKDMIDDTEAKKLWINALRKLEPVIKEKLKNALRIHTEKSNQEFIDDFVHATREALTLVEYFSWHRNPGIVTHEGSNPVGTKEGESAPRVRVGIRAKVLNENGQGVFDISVELLNSTRQRISLQTTNVTGQVDFGKSFKNGQYIIRVLPPDSVPVRGAREYRFNLNSNEIGYRAVFKLAVEAGREVRPRLKAKMLEPEWVTLPEKVAYQLDRARGVLLINIAHEALNKALMEGDELMQLILLCRYTSDAHALLLSVDEPELLLQIAAELNGKLFPLLAEKRAARRSETKGARMKHNRRSV